jgi:isoleucyl-tRNA synthetase
MPFKDVPQDVKFPEEEEKILKYWDDIDAFQESLRSKPQIYFLG